MPEHVLLPVELAHVEIKQGSVFLGHFRVESLRVEVGERELLRGEEGDDFGELVNLLVGVE